MVTLKIPNSATVADFIGFLTDRGGNVVSCSCTLSADGPDNATGLSETLKPFLMPHSNACFFSFFLGSRKLV
jgi:hypothetical protein